MRNQRQAIQKPDKKSDKPNAKDNSTGNRDKTHKKHDAAIAILRYRRLISD
jgi:hypothetical protein